MPDPGPLPASPEPQAAAPDAPPAAAARAPSSALTAGHLLARQRRVALSTVALPALGLIAGLALMVAGKVPPAIFAIWAAMHVLTAIGISVGFHRLATHQSFKCGRWTKRTLLILGSIGAQGPVVHWATNHRRHHHTCDRAGDPHSPHVDEAGESFDSRLAGWWHAHAAWLFRSSVANPVRYSLDLIKDSDVLFVNRHYGKWVLLGVLLPGLAAAAVTRTWPGFALGCLVGGVARIAVVQHLVWSINSLTHMFGARPYANADLSSNLAWLALPTAGESWHNNHHAFPYSARLGLEWWQLDIGWWTLVALRTFGLAWEIKLPTAEGRSAKRRDIGTIAS